MDSQSLEIASAIRTSAEAIAKSGMYSDWLIVAATVSAAIAAFFSAYAALTGPRKAAEEVEKIRAANESRQAKLEIFSQVLSTRPLLWVHATAIALNRIDVAFSDSQSVRDAWARLYRALQGKIDPKEEKRFIAELIRAMAQDLGLSSSLTEDTLERVYHSDIMFAILYSQAIQAYEILGFSREEALARIGLELPASQRPLGPS